MSLLTAPRHIFFVVRSYSDLSKAMRRQDTKKLRNLSLYWVLRLQRMHCVKR